ncbi:MAG TPA: SPOR domain-containing protein [Chromatiales bacterium]|nr:SPOR domain-containing protein [Chromatiales bacterium]
MARDYRRSRRSSSGRSGWVPFLSGFGLGLIAAFGVYVAGGYRIGQGVADCPQPRKAHGPQASQSEPQTESRFDFYTLLPNFEVEVPADESGPKTPARRTPKPREQRTPRSEPPRTPPTPAGRYILQAGSFKRYGEADALKARLALMGLHASIQKVKVGETVYHRVRVGPFPSFAQAEQAQRRLRQASVDSLLMKLGN